MIFHPASLLFAWACLAVLLQRLPIEWLLPTGLCAIATALVVAKPLYRSMLRRTQWLFLTLFVLFLTMTPGVYLAAPWSFGILTSEGLAAAGEHVVRLAAMLGLVALLLCVLDQRAIVAGLFVLLRPFAACGVDRERISVRLLLVLDQVAANKQEWRALLRAPAPVSQTEPVRLAVAPLRGCDAALTALAAIAMISGWYWS